MSKPDPTPAPRISRDSGIGWEDSDQNNKSSPSPSLLSSTSAAKKNFPAKCGSKTNSSSSASSSYVRRLTERFENFTTGSDECDRSSPPTTSNSCNLRMVKTKKKEEKVLEEEKSKPVIKVNEPVLSEREKSDSKQHLIDVTRQINQNACENDSKKDQQLGACCANYLISVNDQPVEKIQIDNSCFSEITEEDVIQNHVDRYIQFGEESNESLPPLEAQQSFIFQHASQFAHCCDDSEFSDNQCYPLSRNGSNTSIQSVRIAHIMEELLENEENYVQSLEKGIENYVSVMQYRSLPVELKGLRYHIFGNIEKIHRFHADSFLPDLRQNQASIKGIAETFIKCIEEDRFYCYIMFALNRPKSERICKKNKDFFQEVQTQIGDKLGIHSFLMQPIQRLPRYKLLLAEINKEVLKMIAESSVADSVKNEIGILCKAEKRLENFISILNEAISVNDIRDCNELNLKQQGKFRKTFEMEINDKTRCQRYPGKIFIFDKCIVYTEKMKKYLEYRGHYTDSEVGLYIEGKSKLCLYAKTRGVQEVELIANFLNVVKKMAAHIEYLMRNSQERQIINEIILRRSNCNGQPVTNVTAVNRESTMSNISNLSVSSSECSLENQESESKTTWYTLF